MKWSCGGGKPLCGFSRVAKGPTQTRGELCAPAKIIPEAACRSGETPGWDFSQRPAASGENPPPPKTKSVAPHAGLGEHRGIDAPGPAPRVQGELRAGSHFCKKKFLTPSTLMFNRRIKLRGKMKDEN